MKKQTFGRCRFALLLCVAATAMALTGCGKNKTNTEEIIDVSTADSYTEEDSFNPSAYDDQPFVEIDGTSDEQFLNVVMNMKPYIDTYKIYEQLGHTENPYDMYDYDYYDYDFDGVNEVILRLKYMENNEDMRDTVLLDFVDNKVIVKSMIGKEFDDNSFYCYYTDPKAKDGEQKEFLAKYEWDLSVSPATSAIYIVDYSGETIQFETAEAFDEVKIDLEEIHIRAMPLYQYVDSSFCDQSPFH